MAGESNGPRIRWTLLLSELIGTALLVLLGLSLVIVMFGDGSPVAQWPPSEGLRRLITGFFFGTIGASIALSPVGRVSGAHINPVVTKIRPFTPAIFPPLHAIMVWAEAPISGTSTNPARSLGPALVSEQWHGWWIYWIGPMVGMLLAVLACSFLAKRIEVAKLYYFDSGQDRLFRRNSACSK